MHTVCIVQELWAHLPEEQKLWLLEMGLQEGMIRRATPVLLLMSLAFCHFGQSSFLTPAALARCVSLLLSLMQIFSPSFLTQPVPQAYNG
jgi:hypothetical protein